VVVGDRGGGAGLRVEAVQLDVADPASIASAVETVRTKCAAVAPPATHLDILVNNAGILLEAEDSTGRAPPWDAESARRTLAVNFEGVVAVTTALLPLLQAAPGGASILSTSSGVHAAPRSRTSCSLSPPIPLQCQACNPHFLPAPDLQQARPALRQAYSSGPAPAVFDCTD